MNNENSNQPIKAKQLQQLMSFPFKLDQFGLTEENFYKLKKSGMLWEFHPQAKNYWEPV